MTSSFIPRSTVFKEQAILSTQAPHGNSSVYHFTVGHNYTPESIQHPNGAFPCFYCPRRPTFTRLFFTPVSRKEPLNTIIWSPIPHCSPSCVLGTLLAEQNAYEQLGLFHELFPNTPIPPPRYMFHIPAPGKTTQNLIIPFNLCTK
jgi:hypothetical protein